MISNIEKIIRRTPELRFQFSPKIFSTSSRIKAPPTNRDKGLQIKNIDQHHSLRYR